MDDERRVTIRTIEVPDDFECVVLSAEDWRRFVETLAAGEPVRVIVTDDSGAEVTVDLPPPSARQ